MFCRSSLWDVKAIKRQVRASKPSASLKSWKISKPISANSINISATVICMLQPKKSAMHSSNTDTTSRRFLSKSRSGISWKSSSFSIFSLLATLPVSEIIHKGHQIRLFVSLAGLFFHKNDEFFGGGENFAYIVD